MKSTRDGTTKYLADTYAYIEILKDNKNYHPYKECALITTELNIAELAYWFIRTGNAAGAKETSRRLWKERASLTLTAIRNAMRFKHERRKDRLSYADCLGYALAAELGIPFLTGDEKFEGLPNVEHVQ